MNANSIKESEKDEIFSPNFKETNLGESARQN